MKLNLINSWNALNKSWDKVNLEFRIGKLTALLIRVDVSDRAIEIMILNFGISFRAKR